MKCTHEMYPPNPPLFRFLNMPLHLFTAGQKDMQVLFLPRDALSAKRGLAIACRPSVCLYPSVRPSVTLVDCDH